MNTLSNTVYLIRSLIDIEYPAEDPNNSEIRQNIISFLNTAYHSYVLVEWPESQEFMDKAWFKEEAVLALGSEDKTGSSAYFIPINRLS